MCYIGIVGFGLERLKSKIILLMEEPLSRDSGFSVYID